MKKADSRNPATRISIDFTKSAGPVKPVHSTGQGPLLGGKAPDFSMFRYLKEAGVPYARLHDVAGRFGGNLYVDIPNLFRDFDADENDPASYDFTFTDLYLSALVENGVEPYFRLGVTIENYAGGSVGKAYRIFPPKDFKKWARICEHVIRHYTEGWADGFHHKITYWEIWNEPDDFIDNRNQMWRGTWKQFCDLYEVAAKHLKAKFPHLKIGGYGRCTAHHVTYELRGQPVSAEEEYRKRCFEEFCEMLKERKPPLDFFSFHGYITPDLVAPHTDYHRRMLRDAGYGKAELHLNEWLCGDTSGYFWRRPSLSSVIAAFIAACQLTKDLKLANIYDAKCGLSAYAPLFDPIARKPAKAFYALKYFNSLYQLGRAVKCDVEGGQGADGLWCVAAKAVGRTRPQGEPSAAALIVNDSTSPRLLSMDFGGRKPVSCRIVDGPRTDAEIPFPDTLPPHSFLLVELA